VSHYSIDAANSVPSAVSESAARTVMFGWSNDTRPTWQKWTTVLDLGPFFLLPLAALVAYGVYLLLAAVMGW
jgi:hypothetical protein